MANGHAFNEIWDPALQKWVFIDSFVSFYVVDRASGVPLSALEFRAALLEEPDAEAIEVMQTVPERFPFKSVERALDWYRRGEIGREPGRERVCRYGKISVGAG